LAKLAQIGIIMNVEVDPFVPRFVEDAFEVV
jgi:hypothetical protein